MLTFSSVFAGTVNFKGNFQAPEKIGIEDPEIEGFGSFAASFLIGYLLEEAIDEVIEVVISAWGEGQTEAEARNAALADLQAQYYARIYGRNVINVVHYGEGVYPLSSGDHTIF